jgi:hypothetical protein
VVWKRKPKHPFAGYALDDFECQTHESAVSAVLKKHFDIPVEHMDIINGKFSCEYDHTCVALVEQVDRTHISPPPPHC